jgi:aryl-alcohol dehydrogenase-like predicted oxidoreductase
MKNRKLGSFDVSAIGLGCMSMSHGYGAPDDSMSANVLHRALDLGYTLLDTAVLYGFGANETLIGNVLKDRRDEYMLTSKCGIYKDEEGKRKIDSSPTMIKKSCEDSLRRLQTDVIDLYYLHRVDINIPMEDSLGAMSDLVEEGKIKSVGMSEVSAETLRKANSQVPIAAVQSEYSLWTRNAEIAVLQTCKELGVSFVAFSPLARSFLTGKLRDMSGLQDKDLRHNMPRFQGENFQKNLLLLDEYSVLADEVGCTMGQLALAWILAQGDYIIPIPGTKHLGFLEENFAAMDVELTDEQVKRAGQIINQDTVTGPRYVMKTQLEVDMEKFPGELENS